MPATYEPIATTTLGSAAASITFSSIASSWTDIKVVLVGTATAGTPDVYLRFNSDSATNYSRTILTGNGTTASSSSSSNIAQVTLTTGTGFGSTVTLRQADIFSYAGSTYKTALTSESSDLNGSGTIVSAVHLWRSTSAINAISLTTSASTFTAGTTATLYGIKNA